MQRVPTPSRRPRLAAYLPLFLLIPSVCLAQGNTASATSRYVVSSVQRFYGLTEDEVASGLPVRIEGVVLYSDPNWQLFWLKDESGRLFIPVPPEAQVPPARTRSIVTGTTMLVDGKYRIDNVRIQEVGPGELPPSRLLMPLELDDQKQLEGMVSLAGTVIDAEMRKDQHLRLVVAFLNRFRVRVTINNCSPDSLVGLLGAEVEVSGCASPMEADQRKDTGLLSHQVFVPDLTSLTVFKLGPRDPYSAPLLPLAKLATERRQHRDPRLIRVRGKVTSKQGSNTIVLQEGERSVQVRLRSSMKLPTGSEVEVVGSLWLDQDQAIFIDRALARSASATSVAKDTQAAELPVLKTAQALHGLTRQMASKSYPVEIEGVVIYNDPVWRVMFVHDGRRGCYVDDKRRKHELRLGDRVTVKGVSDPGGFAPMVIASEVRKLGQGELPTPRSVSFGRMLSGAEDSQWLTLRGVIQSAEKSQENIVLSLKNSTGEFEAVICGAAGQLNQRNWVGSDVLLTGVCGVKANAEFQPIGIYFHVPDADHADFRTEAPSDPFAIPQTQISDVLKFEVGARDFLEQVRISGVVTYADRSGLVAVQDKSQGILVRIKTSDAPKVNEVVDLIGIPVADSWSPAFRVAAWKPSGVADIPPTPKPVLISDMEDVGFDGQLVSIEAIVLRNNCQSAVPSLTLQADGVVFPADLASITTATKWAEIQEQSVVRVPGVLDIRSDDWDRMQSFRLLVAMNAKVDVIQPAPWWTPGHTTTLVLCLATVIVLALIWGIALRITVRRQMGRIRQELDARAELATKHQTLVENAGELIFSIQRSGEFVNVNPATERVFDVPHRRLLGQRVTNYLCEESAEVFDLLTSRLAADQPHAVVELTTKRGLVLETAARLEKDELNSDEVQCIARDISDRRRLEDQIRQIQKMDSIGQLAAGVAHDYNNMLAVVRMNNEMLSSANLTEYELKSVSLIRTAVDHAEALTQQLLAFGRRQAMDTTTVRLGDLLSEVVEMLRPLIGEDIELQLIVEEPVPVVNADKGMIQQAVMNLALNARDAMPDGGVMTISVQPVTISPRADARDVETLPGDYAEISVSDTGKGIDNDVLSHIFEPFFSTKDVGKGTGLGLSTVFGIVKQHEGAVYVDSTPGEGSRFTILLPSQLAKGDDQPLRFAGDRALAAGDHQTVLVVEDDSSVRLTMSQVLERAGYHVVQSVNGVEALKIWNRMNGDCDLIITDMVMPGGISGAEFARKIKASSPDIPIIYCTGYSAEIANASSLSSTERLLPKPFNGSQLVRVVHELLNVAASIGPDSHQVPEVATSKSA